MKNLKQIENLHILFWLLKDNSWCHEWKTLGVVMIVPTLLVQAWIVFVYRKQTHEIYHSVGVLFWIMANAVWMCGEFFVGGFDDHLRWVPSIFFGLGLATIIFYYVAISWRCKKP